MPNASRVTFNIQDISFSIASVLAGVFGVIGITERGPVAKPDLLITSWPQFARIYGGLIDTSDFPLICKRALEAGCKLRVCRVVNFDEGESTATKATTTGFIVTGSTVGFELLVKYPGAAYNNLKSVVSAASNGSASHFNLTIYIDGDSLAKTEVYRNLTLPGNPTIANSHYLDEVIQRSELVDVDYKDLSGTSGSLRPTNVTKSYSTGSNGGTIVAADYVGDTAGKNGLYAFDGISDIFYIAIPEISDTDVHIGGASYADSRKDLRYIGHLDNSLTTAAALITERQSITTDTPYATWIAGGLRVTDPANGGEKEISEIGDILGLIAYTHARFGPWFSYAGTTRGKIKNVLGVVNNFGGPGAYADRDSLAQAQINVVVHENNMVVLRGNFSGTLGNSKMSYNNIVDLVIYIAKSTKPTFERYIEEPTDFISFKRLYQEIQPFLEDLKKSKRALYDYRYQGDQDATTLEELTINNPDDLDVGRYRVRMFLKPINSINEIIIDVVITPSGVSFEEALV